MPDNTWPILSGTAVAASGAGVAFGGGGAAFTLINWGPRAAGFFLWAGSGQGQSILNGIAEYIDGFAGKTYPTSPIGHYGAGASIIDDAIYTW